MSDHGVGSGRLTWLENHRGRRGLLILLSSYAQTRPDFRHSDRVSLGVRC